MATAALNIQNPVILARASKGLTVEGAVAKANSEKVIIAPNKHLDWRLVLTDTWKEEKSLYPAWAGELVAHNEPNTRLGDYITYTDPESKITYRIKVPKEFANLENALLVVQHGFVDGKPIFEIRDVENEKNSKEIWVPDERRIQVVTDLPAENGWYSTETNFGIPTGQKVNSTNSDARYLWRADKILSLAARGWDYFGDRRDVDLDDRSSDCLGVLGFAQEGPKSGAQAATPTEAKEVQVTIPNISIHELSVLLQKAKGEAEKLVARVEGDALASINRLIEVLGKGHF